MPKDEEKKKEPATPKAKFVFAKNVRHGEKFYLKGTVVPEELLKDKFVAQYVELARA